MKGKNFSKNNTGKRIINDAYSTPYSITEQLLEVEMFDSFLTILEPCCGKKAIVKVLERNGYKHIIAFDKYYGKNKQDFFNYDKKVDYIITNPPFKSATKFIEKAMEITKYKICLLLPLNYLHGKYRYENIYKKKRLKKVYIFTRYPMLSSELRSDGKYSTGMQVLAWFVFDMSKIYDRPEIDWIDNNSYVIGSRKK